MSPGTQNECAHAVAVAPRDDAPAMIGGVQVSEQEASTVRRGLPHRRRTIRLPDPSTAYGRS